MRFSLSIRNFNMFLYERIPEHVKMDRKYLTILELIYVSQEDAVQLK